MNGAETEEFEEMIKKLGGISKRMGRPVAYYTMSEEIELKSNNGNNDGFNVK